MATPLAESTASIDELAQKLHRQMFNIISNMRRHDWDRIVNGDLTLMHISVLHYLSEKKRERVTRLAAAENVGGPAMSKAVLQLVKLGLVKRVRDQSDARGVWVEITPQGVELKNESVRSYLDMIKATLAPSQIAFLSGVLNPLERIVVDDKTLVRSECQGISR